GSNFTGINSFSPYASLSSGIPVICCSNINISSGSITLPGAALERSTGTGLLKRGYIESWNLVVERKLPANFIVSVGYVGTHTVHQFGDLDVNSSLPGTGAAGQPYNKPQFGNRTASTLFWQGYLSANYNALQVSINRQFSRG